MEKPPSPCPCKSEECSDEWKKDVVKHSVRMVMQHMGLNERDAIKHLMEEHRKCKNNRTCPWMPVDNDIILEELLVAKAKGEYVGGLVLPHASGMPYFTLRGNQADVGNSVALSNLNLCIGNITKCPGLMPTTRADKCECAVAQVATLRPTAKCLVVGEWTQ